ncbi:MAG: MFS transporter [Bacteroides graminisolvens]
MVVSVSVTLFIFARFVLAVGEAGNFPAAIKVFFTAEYFPKKDRALSTSIFNAGATVGALAAPVTIPVIGGAFRWETAFIIIGALGFIWMGFWVFVYKKPEDHPKVNAAELTYIQQDKDDTQAFR